MKTIAENELEAELQEMYIQAAHWLNDVSFLETETRFFQNIIERYQPASDADLRNTEFAHKIAAQNSRLNDLRLKIPAFLNFLKPFIGNIKKEIDLEFLGRYNALQDELTALFSVVRANKNELFRYTETIMQPVTPVA